jgi:putative transposase
MTHVRTSPSYPQSNGKLERWHESLKSECIRPRTPLSLQDAKRLIQQYVDRYNNVRSHSAIGYVTPKDMLAGRQTTTSESPPASRVKSEVASHRDVGQARKAILTPSR